MEKEKKDFFSYWGRNNLMSIWCLLSTGTQPLNFLLRGRAALTIRATNSIPKEKQYSTRKEMWGLEGWYCKLWLKSRRAQKKRMKMGECKRRIRSITKLKMMKALTEKNGIAKSRSLTCKRKKNREMEVSRKAVIRSAKSREKQKYEQRI